MKKAIIIAVAAFSLQSCLMSGRPNREFMPASVVAPEAKFTTLNMPMFAVRPFINKQLKQDGDIEQLVRLMKKIKKVRITTVENSSPAMRQAFDTELKKQQFQDWVTVNSEGQKINILAQQRGEQIRKLLIAVNSEDQIVYIDLKGKFTVDDISALADATEKQKKK